MNLIFAGGDLGGADFVGILLIFVVLPIAAVIVLLKVFLGRKNGR